MKIYLLSFSLILLFSFNFGCKSKTYKSKTGNSNQRILSHLELQEKALKDLYALSKKDDVKNFKNVKPSVDTFWPGVKEVDSDGFVTKLSLSSNQLEGKIPASIGALKNLTELNLSNNNLTGGIPKEIETLKALKNLNLSYNKLEDKIPASIGELKNLTFLNLSSNRKWNNTNSSYEGRFEGKIPPSIGELKNLTSLDLSDNQLTGAIPDSIGELKNLIFLNLSRNKLEGSIPPSIGELKNLIFLNLSDNNQLTGDLPKVLKDKETLGKLTYDPPK